MYTKDLLTVSYHYDDDTGMYDVGEVDFGIHGELDTYIEKYGITGANKIILTLGYLTSAVFDKIKTLQLKENKEDASDK